MIEGQIARFPLSLKTLAEFAQQQRRFGHTAPCALDGDNIAVLDFAYRFCRG
jgi:hypothetical protein